MDPSSFLKRWDASDFLSVNYTEHKKLHQITNNKQYFFARIFRMASLRTKFPVSQNFKLG